MSQDLRERVAREDAEALEAIAENVFSLHRHGTPPSLAFAGDVAATCNGIARRLRAWEPRAWDVEWRQHGEQWQRYIRLGRERDARRTLDDNREDWPDREWRVVPLYALTGETEGER